MSAGRRPILIVEDDDDLIACLRAVLDEERRPMIAVHDGVSAVAACREHPLLVLVDLNIPGGLTGASLLASLRDTLGHDTPLILLSAERDLSLRAHELGADGSLEKPFDIDDLLRLIDDEARRVGDTDEQPAAHP